MTIHSIASAVLGWNWIRIVHPWGLISELVRVILLTYLMIIYGLLEDWHISRVTTTPVLLREHQMIIRHYQGCE